MQNTLNVFARLYLTVKLILKCRADVVVPVFAVLFEIEVVCNEVRELQTPWRIEQANGGVELPLLDAMTTKILVMK